MTPNNEKFAPEDIEAARLGAEKAAKTMARRQGLVLRKSRRRNPDAPEYGRYGLFDGGTPIYGYDMSLEQVVTYLNTRQDDAVVRIERYHVTAVWTKQPDGSWNLGCMDNGTHFHLFDANEREHKAWGGKLPEALQRVVYPGSYK
jgi:hypothetical protein